MPKNDRPVLTCLQCGTGLRPHRKTVTVDSQASADSLVAGLKAWQRATVHENIRILKPSVSNAFAASAPHVTRRPITEEDLQPKTWAVSYTDALGDYGDNRFCGLNCGYAYAFAHSKTVGVSRSREINR